MTDADAQPESHAEETDPTKLGETVGDVDRPGDIFPPDEPLGVEDPSILADGSIARDDVESRSDRERPEVSESSVSDDDELGHDLLDPSADPDLLDDTAQMVASEGDEGDSGPEVDAIHMIPSDRLQ